MSDGELYWCLECEDVVDGHEPCGTVDCECECMDGDEYDPADGESVRDVVTVQAVGGLL